VSRALAGIRVLDLTQWLQGPVCAQHLADFGAEVIHIERPVTGDGARGVRSIKALPVGDWNQYFLVINRNKRSMAIDLKKQAGRDLVCKLAEKSDVFLSNFPMEVLRGLGLTYETLAAANPGIVYATNTGYGHAVEVNRPSYDINVQALTGIMTRQGEPGQPPIYLGMGSGDTLGGMMSALGIMLALYERRRTGRGQFIDASLYGAQLFMGAATLQPYLASKNDFYASQRPRAQARNPLWNRYEARDKWLFLCLANDDASWAKLGRTLDLPSLAADPRFASAKLRAANHEQLIAALDDVLKSRTAEEWMDRWVPAGIPASPIQTLADVARDPQAWANDYLMKTHCGEVNREVEIRGLPITLSRTPGHVATLGPELGQDTELILMDVLEMEWDRIEELKAQGVIP